MHYFHHRKLPDFSTLLAGHTPPNEIGFQSDLIQIWYNNTDTAWGNEVPHYHAESDECFIVLRGKIIVEIEGEQHTINAGEFCCFPRGLWHAVVAVETPVESLMVRAPSVQDKVYQTDE